MKVFMQRFIRILEVDCLDTEALIPHNLKKPKRYNVGASKKVNNIVEVGK